MTTRKRRRQEKTYSPKARSVPLLDSEETCSRRDTGRGVWAQVCEIAVVLEMGCGVRPEPTALLLYVKRTAARTREREHADAGEEA